MKRDQQEHVLRAAAAITRENEFVIIGSQSMLGAIPDAPAELKLSREVDIYPLHKPGLADLIDGAIAQHVRLALDRNRPVIDPQSFSSRMGTRM